jgi:ADP-ribose pyrophosphatase YjhB (NUDIX family)
MINQDITFELSILKLGYNLIVGKVKNLEKVLYIHKFPPVLNTTSKPNLEVNSSVDELQSDVHLNKETLINFWKSTDLYQANGDWKGGEWGSNNLPTTDKTFCTGLFVGDKIIIKIIKEGIIPYKTRCSKPFDINDEIIEQSELSAWSCNLFSPIDGLEYSGYVCEQPMPQSAIDVLFIWENNLKQKFVKVLRRGNSHPNVDMPCMLMPGAGEHREPGNNISFKADVLRAVKEEIGIDQSTLSECYLIPIGFFDGDKRDPRYWSWTASQSDNKSDKIIKFGLERVSSTDVYVLYIKSETKEEPKETTPSDSIEVNKKMWVRLDESGLSNREIWMIPEHSYYFSIAINSLNRFDDMPIEYKISKKIFI